MEKNNKGWISIDNKKPMKGDIVLISFIAFGKTEFIKGEYLGEDNFFKHLKVLN